MTFPAGPVDDFSASDIISVRKCIICQELTQFYCLCCVFVNIKAQSKSVALAKANAGSCFLCLGMTITCNPNIILHFD